MMMLIGMILWLSLKVLPPEQRPHDWLYAYAKIPQKTPKKFFKMHVLECLKAMEDAEFKERNENE